MGPTNHTWKPLQAEKLARVGALFSELFPEARYGALAADISAYWVRMLQGVWETKPPAMKKKDESYIPRDPLSRIQQRTVVITYADSVRTTGEASLETLDGFLRKYFPAIGGMHMLPACQVVEERFNDGYFSQVVRDRIHPVFGTNRKFADMMARYCAMADLFSTTWISPTPISRPTSAVMIPGGTASTYSPKRNTGGDLIAAISARYFVPAPFRFLPFSGVPRRIRRWPPGTGRQSLPV